MSADSGIGKRLRRQPRSVVRWLQQAQTRRFVWQLVEVLHQSLETGVNHHRLADTGPASQVDKARYGLQNSLASGPFESFTHRLRAAAQVDQRAQQLQEHVDLAGHRHIGRAGPRISRRESGEMERAAILGLGVVGRTMVARGGDVAVGIDVNPDRIDLCRSTAGSATDDINAVRGCKLVFICVGTPVLPDGRQDGTQVKRALEDLKAVIDADTVVVIRSTITPEFLPKEYPNSVVVNPEFLRADSAMHDALHPPFVVVGADPEALAVRVFHWYSQCGVSTEAPKLLCAPIEAILLKFACNWFHTVKVEFANMVGELAEKMGAPCS